MGHHFADALNRALLQKLTFIDATILHILGRYAQCLQDGSKDDQEPDEEGKEEGAKANASQ